MKNLFKIILLVMVISYWPPSIWASTDNENHIEKNYFQFVIPEYHTNRQSGQTVNIYVRYAYKKKLPNNQYPDYRVLRTAVLKYMEPTVEFPAEVFWEILATAMGRDLMKNYPLDGVSIQLDVLDNQNPNSFEPGDHGPTFTVGDIEPLDVHH
ncbi:MULTISPECIES: hypothetical protein [Legionella]|uniref:Uncharacterized protein n=1 Tax=Legionella resiliens TaxID=2905958 RepID=A0ABS8X798_9GAMM|nr:MULTISPECIES: hypothetical protein [unclassified Legionella]MCE0724250.1 hypothetical protein [Legionella sp. 9fVS26]MCE3533402.1 hypothetical protein [Legionella sp. 8cVS16]QLZ69587.1 hypothetical protein FOLKNPGA_02381 [Legionella sp. PC1000]